MPAARLIPLLPSFPPVCLDTLRTERLTLRVATLGHAAALHAYHVDNRQHLKPWEPARTDRFFEADAIAGRLQSMVAQQVNGHALHLLLFERTRDELIGECNFTNIVRGPFDACHLGFSISKRFEGRGFAREGLRTAINHVFGVMNLHRVMANYRPENQRSARLLERLGFEKEGVARAYLKIDGEWADHVLTSRINPHV
ncbi:GNAT family N-acetyltransferase [Paraburkholderia sp.]|uniref:GNAT family N-acetyltransferase n=1 Tax=Paraburkholderia sp. TaxID=1926495 RepID=UPI0023982B8C|nr:GNAT family N-acetyltransferase [Paraburkholderia sp.]MDE1182444.1 GNAT family N-acetyltransferase [Paraburkholderia sp.]